MKYITTTDIAEIIGLNRNSVHTYLAGYRFSKFRLIDADCMKSRFILNKDFITVLYNFLWHKRKKTEANRLKKYFNDYEIHLISREEFIGC